MPNVILHDYSGSTTSDLKTDSNGKLTITVPPKSYCILGPKGITGGFVGRSRRTTQEFQLDDDLGDNQGESLGYGGKLVPGEYRTGGAVWVAENTVVKVWLYSDNRRAIQVCVNKPELDGTKATDQGGHSTQGFASSDEPLYMEFTPDREGYHQVAAKLREGRESPARGYIKVEYEAPPASQKF